MSRNRLNTQTWDGASFSVHSFRVVCAVTHTIAGNNYGSDGVRELVGEDIKRRYVRDEKTTRDHTGTTPGAEEACFVAAYARVAFAGLAVWAIGLTRPAYPRGLPTTDCMHRFTSTVSTSIRASWRLQGFRLTVS